MNFYSENVIGIVEKNNSYFIGTFNVFCFFLFLGYIGDYAEL